MDKSEKAKHWDELVEWVKEGWQEVNTPIDLRTNQGRYLNAKHTILVELMEKFPEIKTFIENAQVPKIFED